MDTPVTLKSDNFHGADTGAFADFQEHSRGRRAATDLVTLEAIRKAHPEHHVTCTAKASCDLLSYANAGHAASKLDVDNESFAAIRNYVKPSVRLSDDSGSLSDEFTFGRFYYAWEDSTFMVYLVKWTDRIYGLIQKYYVLSPRSKGDISENHLHCDSTDKLLLAAGKWTGELHEEIYVFDDGRCEKNAELWKSVQNSSWDEVILDPQMKKRLIGDVQGFFDSQSLYREFAVPWKRGIIFHGLPGNGKTVSIKALISSLQKRPDAIPSLYVKSFDTCRGPQYAIRSIFNLARSAAPCLLIFEDLDSLVSEKVRSYFLNEVDGLESNDGILMIGSTNHLASLDPAISQRPSRFDRKYHFKIPDEQERALYCNFWRRKLVKNATLEFPKELCQIIAKFTEGFSFAYLKELFITALLIVAGGTHVDDDVKGPAQTESNGAVNGKPATDENAGNEGEPAVEMDASDTLAVKTGENTIKPKRAVPEVDIPENLRDCVLLKVLRQQTKNLLAEMDNTKAEDWLSSKIPPDASKTTRGLVRVAMQTAI